MSPKDKAFAIRLEPDEFERLREEADKAGFKNISEFIRYVTIGEGRTILKQLQSQSEDIQEIRDDVKKILRKLEKK
jgi:hypothetical protein